MTCSMCGARNASYCYSAVCPFAFGLQKPQKIEELKIPQIDEASPVELALLKRLPYKALASELASRNAARNKNPGPKKKPYTCPKCSAEIMGWVEFQKHKKEHKP